MVSSFWGIAAQEAKKCLKLGVPLAKLYCFCHVTNNYLGGLSFCHGPSMMPTIHPTGNIVLVERISTRFQRVGRGDIVLFRSPESPRKIPTKRVIGVEGDRITYVVDPGKSDECRTVVVPKGHLWVQGDYQHNSRDSRMFGPVPYGLLVGKALWRIWPFKDFGPLETYPS